MAKKSQVSSTFLVPKWLLWICFIVEILLAIAVILYCIKLFASHAEQNPFGALGEASATFLILFYWILYVPGYKIVWQYIQHYPPPNKPFKYKVSKAPGWFIFVVLCYFGIACIVGSVGWSLEPGNTFYHIGGGLLMLLGIFLVIVVPGYTLFSYLRQLPKAVKK